jgi:hypothetical protein
MKFQEFLSIKESLQTKGNLNESLDSNKTRQLIKEYIDTVGLENAIRLNEGGGNDDFLSKLKSIINYGIALSKLDKYKEEYKKGGSKENIELAQKFDIWPLKKKEFEAEGDAKQKIKDQIEDIENRNDVEAAKLEEEWRKFKEEWDELTDEVGDPYKSSLDSKKLAIEAEVQISAKEALAQYTAEAVKHGRSKEAQQKAKEKIDNIKKELQALNDKKKEYLEKSENSLNDTEIDENEMKNLEVVMKTSEWKNFTTSNVGLDKAKANLNNAEKLNKDKKDVDSLKDIVIEEEVKRNEAFNKFREYVKSQGDKVGNTIKSIAGLEYTKSKGDNKGEKVEDKGEMLTDKEEIIKKYKGENSDKENSDKENSDKENSDKENITKAEEAVTDAEKDLSDAEADENVGSDEIQALKDKVQQAKDKVQELKDK